MILWYKVSNTWNAARNDKSQNDKYFSTNNMSGRKTLHIYGNQKITLNCVYYVVFMEKV